MAADLDVPARRRGDLGVAHSGSGEGKTAASVRVEPRADQVPALLTPPNESVVSHPEPSTATTALTWRAVASAVAYRVRLDTSSSFARPVVDRAVSKGTSIEVAGLKPGTYYWDVAAIDKDGRKGGVAAFSRFTIALEGAASAVSAPPLRIEPLSPNGHVVKVKGSTEPEAAVTINGDRVAVADDGSFDEFVTFDTGAQALVVRSVSLSGGIAELRLTVTITE